MQKHQYVIHAISTKFERSKPIVNLADKIIEDILKREQNKQEKQRKKEELTEQQNFLMDKIDFHKRFFEPILEESELEAQKGKSLPIKSSPKKMPRHIITKINFQNPSLGIVPNLDKEETASPDFKRRQSKFFTNLTFQKNSSQKEMFLTQLEEDLQADQQFKNEKEQKKKRLLHTQS